MLATLRRTAILLVCIPVAVAQQQTWVPAEAPGAVGVPVLGSPLPPRLIEATRSTTLPSTPVWEFTASRFHRRTEATPPELQFAEAAVYDVANARIVVWCSAFLPGLSGTASVCSFDGARWSVVTAGLPSARQQPALAYDPRRGAVVLFGGVAPTSFPSLHLQDTWELRGNQWAQVATSTAPSPRAGASLAFDPRAQGIVLFGGSLNLSVLGDTWSFDGAQWTPLASSGPAPRSEAALAFDPQRQAMVLYGGQSAVPPFAGVCDDTWEWNGSSWQVLGAPLARLSRPALFADASGMLLCGRDDFAGQLLVYRRSGAAWTPVYTHQELPRLASPALAFDGLRGQLVRFGGTLVGPQTLLGDTAVWQGLWLPIAVASAPPARRNSAMAFDPLRGECVLFGGLAGTLLDDTWTWNGSVWTQHAPTVSPPARSNPAMAFDASRGTVVLHGGDNGLLQWNDTWEWDGVNWSAVPTPATATGWQRSLAYDATRGVLALYLRIGTSGWLYELRAGGWTVVSTLAPGYADLAYDPVRGNLVLFDPAQRFDCVGGAFVPDPQPRYPGYLFVDTQRQQLLGYAADSVDQPIAYSVPVPATAVAYGQGCGPLGETTLAVDRAPQLGAAQRWQVRALAPAPVLLGLSLRAGNTPLGNGCTQWLGNGAVWLFGIAGQAGWAEVAAAVPQGIGLLGMQIHAQAVVLHPPLSLAFSNGVREQLGQ